MIALEGCFIVYNIVEFIRQFASLQRKQALEKVIDALSNERYGPLECIFEMREGKGVLDFFEDFNGDSFSFDRGDCTLVLVGFSVVGGGEDSEGKRHIGKRLVFEPLWMDLMAPNDEFELIFTHESFCL